MDPWPTTAGSRGARGISSTPSLLLELAEEFRSYAQRGGQVLSLHILRLLNALKLEEIYCPRRYRGFIADQPRGGVNNLRGAGGCG